MPEDDPKNPGVSRGLHPRQCRRQRRPTADGFETYGVTGVALIAFSGTRAGSADDVRHRGSSGSLPMARIDDPDLHRPRIF